MRAFARLPPERQRELLRQSGAAERLRRLGRTERASLAGPFWEEQVCKVQTRSASSILCSRNCFVHNFLHAASHLSVA